MLEVDSHKKTLMLKTWELQDFEQGAYLRSFRSHFAFAKQRKELRVMA